MAATNKSQFDQFIVHGNGPEISTYLLQPHFFNANQRYYISLRKATLPYTWKNITSANNIVSFDYGDGSISSVTIPEGTFTFKSLTSYLKNLVKENKQGAVEDSDFSITMREYNGRCKINVGTNGLKFDTGSLGPLLGYPADLLIVDNSAEPTGEVDLDPIKNIHLECNLVEANAVWVSNQANAALIPKPVLKTFIMPAVCPYSTFEIAGQCDSYSVPLGTYSVTNVTIKFTDPNGVLIPFTGPSSATVQIASEAIVSN